MKFDQQHAAIVTGGGSGIGRALALELAKKGVRISILDVVERNGQETVVMVKEEHAKLSFSCEKYPETAAFIKCDVTNPGELASGFGEHKRKFGRLDICINSAGVASKEFFTEDKSNDGSGSWRRVMEINLIAVIDCTRLAFVDTPLIKHVDRKLIADSLGGFIPMSTILQGALELLEDDSKAGACLWISNKKGLQYWSLERESTPFT